MEETKRFDPPKASPMDHVVAGAMELIELVPGGKLTTFLLDQICNPPLQLRLNDWRKEVSDFLNELNENGRIDIEKLREDPEFIDVVTSASRIAVATSVEEKREALRNAILNTAKNIDVLFAEKMIFLRFVEQFGEWHLRILSLFNDPKRFFSSTGTDLFEYHKTNFETMLVKAYPELRNRRELYNFLWDELIQNKLLMEIQIQESVSSGGWDSPRTTPFGKKFIEFISESE